MITGLVVIVFFAVGVWFVLSELQERENRRFDARVFWQDRCPECGGFDTVVTRADRSGVVWVACRSCDAELHMDGGRLI